MNKRRLSFSIFPLFRFPGTTKEDNVPNLIKLFHSKDANSTIRSQVALNGGYQTCTISHLRANKDLYQCPIGFVLDEKTMICFSVLNAFGNFSTGIDLCKLNGSRILNFRNVEELDGFTDLLLSGKNASFLFSLNIK
jgi:hypothetical protein